MNRAATQPQLTRDAAVVFNRPASRHLLLRGLTGANRARRNAHHDVPIETDIAR